MMRKRISMVLVVLIAGIFMANEVSYAWVIAAATAARRARKNLQDRNKQEEVTQVTYDQFMNIRKSDKKYFIIDVLAPESYNKGHIEGAFSFPVETINRETVGKILPKDSKIITYCASFQCPASTDAAKKLAALGYDVVDYKGGLKEWQERGNKLAKADKP